MNKPLFAALLLGLISCLGCTKKNEFQPPPPPGVTVEIPQQKTVTVFDSFPGRLVAHDDVEIRARVKGYLQSIDFDDGQLVEKGDLLFTIEQDSYEAAVKSAEARLAQAQAALKLADATLLRTQKAYETKAVSEVDVLTAEANKQGADAAVMEAQAALDEAELNLSYTKIYAPMNGRLSRRTLSIGNLVGDGQSTILTTLVVESPIDVFFNVDERSLLPFLQDGIRQTRPGSEVPPLKLELANGTLYNEEGELNYIDPEIDPETGTLRARAVFANKDLGLLPGLYGKILVPQVVTNAVLIPDLAIQRDMVGSYVLVVNDDSIVESRYIERGRMMDNIRIVTEGLTTKDRVIVEGIQRARPGILVRAEESQPVDEAAPTAE